MAQITCNNVTIGYDGKEVLKNLSFKVESGDYLCILGENGAGKSTLMKAILLLNEPFSGNFEYGDGLESTEIGYLPQQTEIQKDFPASVREIVQSGCLSKSGLRPFYNDKEKKLAKDSMERMGITHLAKRCYRELSGGQQQRVLLARALCATRKILLLDEPVAGLDPKTTKEMYELISELNQSGITIIMISHDIEAAVKYATDILQLGEKRFFGTKEEYLVSEVGKRYLLFQGGEEKC